MFQIKYFLTNFLVSCATFSIYSRNINHKYWETNKAEIFYLCLWGRKRWQDDCRSKSETKHSVYNPCNPEFLFCWALGQRQSHFLYFKPATLLLLFAMIVRNICKMQKGEKYSKLSPEPSLSSNLLRLRFSPYKSNTSGLLPKYLLVVTV